MIYDAPSLTTFTNSHTNEASTLLAFATATSPPPSACHGQYIAQPYHNYSKLIRETTTSLPRHHITPHQWQFKDPTMGQGPNDGADDATIVQTNQWQCRQPNTCCKNLQASPSMPTLVDTACARRCPYCVAAHIINAHTHWCPCWLTLMLVESSVR